MAPPFLVLLPVLFIASLTISNVLETGWLNGPVIGIGICLNTICRKPVDIPAQILD